MDHSSPPTRRAFLTVAGASLLCSCTASSPAPGAPKSTQPVDVGPVGRFDRDGLYDDWVEAHGFFVVRTGDRLHALSAICTHRRYDLEKMGDQIVCPKHGSLFTPAGQVTKGPAIISLPRFAIRLTPAQTVVVDPGQTFPPGQSNHPQANVIVS